MPGAADHNAEDRDASTDGCSYTKEDVTETLQSIVTTLMGFYDTDPVEFGKQPTEMSDVCRLLPLL